MFLRIDDIGASSKEYEYYGKTSFPLLNKNWPLPEFFTNFLFMKKFPLWSGWAKYRELSVNEWENILDFLSENNLVLNVAITACWVNKESELIRFDKKFPLQSKIIKEGHNKKLIYILNHGLTHCIPGKHLPMRFRSNQKYHREFSRYLKPYNHYLHLKKSQEILYDIFGTYPEIFVPPGNQYNINTLKAMKKLGIKYIQCNRDHSHQPSNNDLENFSIIHIDNKSVNVLHDKDIVINGLDYFKSIKNFSENKYQSMKKLIQ